MEKETWNGVIRKSSEARQRSEETFSVLQVAKIEEEEHAIAETKWGT